MVSKLTCVSIIVLAAAISTPEWHALTVTLSLRPVHALTPSGRNLDSVRTEAMMQRTYICRNNSSITFPQSSRHSAIHGPWILRGTS